MIGRRRASVPADLRARLERARVETLALLRTLDQLALAPRDLPHAALTHLAALDADCAEALWTLDQPRRAIDFAAMVRDSLASLDALADARAHVRIGVPAARRPHLQRLEPLIRATIDPREAYNDVPAIRDPQNR